MFVQFWFVESEMVPGFDGPRTAYQFECDAPDCSLLVRPNSEAELLDVVARHAREYHDEESDSERVRERIEEVEGYAAEIGRVVQAVTAASVVSSAVRTPQKSWRKAAHASATSV